MRVRLHGGLLFVVLLTATAVVQSQDFTYSTNSGTITITGSGCGSVACLVGAVSIPSVINGLPVVSIGGLAFFSDYGLTQVTLPDTVTLIGNGAFWGCSGLTSIVIPPGVTNIGPGAFSQCSSLVDVTIPNGVQNIEGKTFFECSSLTNITIPSGVISIGESAFDGCSILRSVYFRGDAPSLGNEVFSLDNYATIYYLPGTTGWSNTFGGRPAVLWNPQAHTKDGSFGVRQNQFGFNVAGTLDIPLVIEASTDFAARSWAPLQSCTLTNLSIYFSDPQWTNFRSRFYRVRSP